jgi:2,5-diketo-D-gluconate reductase A
MPILTQRFRLNSESTLPAVGFGTYLIAQEKAAVAVRDAISIGYLHVDTAEVYKNEEGVGAGIREGLEASGLSREELFVTTKLWPGAAAWGEETKSREQTIAAFEESLSKLGLKYLDLYLIHSPHAEAKRLEQWKALLELKRSGRVRSVGVSNYSQAHLDEIKTAGLPMPEANQIELHPWSQKPELVAYMKEASIQPIAYSSLAPLSTWRVAPGQDSAKTDSMKHETAVFANMAAKYGVSEAQLLLRWGIQNGYAILPKSTNPERMRQNIDLGGFSIDEADMTAMRSMDRGGGLAWSVGDPTLVS